MMKNGMVRTLVVLMTLAFCLCFANSLYAAEKESRNLMESHTGTGKSIEERLQRLEEMMGQPEGPVDVEKWYKRIEISGRIEVEAYYQEVDFDDPEEDDTGESDVDLAAVELAVDARIVDHVEGHVLFKYEDDDVFVDEGFITLSGPESFPAYLIAGRQYIPFGNYETHFVADPNTLVLGETDQGSVVAGYRIGDELVDISVGAYNGAINKVDDDDHIDSFVAAVVAHPIEGLAVGVSYTSNLASSDALCDAVVDTDADGDAGPVEDLVGGWGAFVTYEFLDRFKLIGEYVGAVDHFKRGELYDAADDKEREPSAWNVEFGAMIIDDLELAVRYGGSDDGGAEFIPESQYGVVVNWGFFTNTNLALEYMHDKYEDDFQKVDTVTAQLAVEF